MLQEQEFPAGTLFCGDAGFVGYDFWRSIVERGYHFLIRVGGNVRLLKDLGIVRQRNDIVYCWPKEALKKKQPPLVLRLFHFQDGRGEMFLVSNILDDQALTAEQASLIYRGRWGVEVQFRSLKQTYGRSKLRSRTPKHAEIELHWSLLGLTMLQLLALKEQTQAGEPVPKTSIATVLRIVRSMIEEQTEIRPSKASLKVRLREAVVDSYQRHGKKKSRNYPRRKEEPSTSAPIISTATKEHKKALRAIGSYNMTE
jgi:Transposase DDE domain